MKPNTIYHEDCLTTMSNMPDNYIDSIVTDPPAGIAFMNKEWDKNKGGKYQWIEWMQSVASEALRVLKPGGHALVWSLPRTSHWTATAWEDAGFEVRDGICHVFGNGFPKSTAIDKQIDKLSKRLHLFEPFAEYLKDKRIALGFSQKDIAKYFPSKTGGLTGCVWNWENAENVPTKEQYIILKNVLNLSDEFNDLIERIEAEREIIGKNKYSSPTNHLMASNFAQGKTERQVLDITAPATPEAQTWNGWGTALKPAYEFWHLLRKPISEKNIAQNVLKWGTGGINIDGCRIEAKPRKTGTKPTSNTNSGTGYSLLGSSKNRQAEYDKLNQGRFPSNFIHDGSEEVLKGFPESKGQHSTLSGKEPFNRKPNAMLKDFKVTKMEKRNDTGSAARFFYCSKAKQSEKGSNNTHPTVKPIRLMRYLVKMITPKGGLCYDPFSGSGTTLKACELENIDYIGSELQLKHIETAYSRIGYKIGLFA